MHPRRARCAPAELDTTTGRAGRDRRRGQRPRHRLVLGDAAHARVGQLAPHRRGRPRPRPAPDGPLTTGLPRRAATRPHPPVPCRRGRPGMNVLKSRLVTRLLRHAYLTRDLSSPEALAAATDLAERTTTVLRNT